jgi:nitrite reductase/ring-hydroxylating ferredoxin subunit
MSFIEVAKIEDIPEGQMKAFTVNGSQVLIVNHQGKYYALAGKCTHMGGWQDRDLSQTWG